MALLLAAIAAVAQTDKSVFTFMGVPVDGSKEQMFLSLNKKGLETRSFFGNKYLWGTFNGENVEVNIYTNNGKVDRVNVKYPYCSESNDTRIKYNTLLSRFGMSTKYVSLVSRDELPPEEQISLNIRNNSKFYDEAFFYLKPSVEPQGWIAGMRNDYELYYGKPLTHLSYEELEEALFCLPDKYWKAVGGVVWFTMESTNQIYINYINLKNRPKGEDL